ncbi:MAG TPA: hypothetical protein VFV58_30960 [Blastocatellia bacterium]|jgi:hypothetical protein|nr:hypothetical protein [Blastocatellia bacterium]
MMKHSVLYVLLLAAGFLPATPSVASAQTLLEKRFSATAESEALLDLTASAPGTSWRERGAEAAVVTIYVDGQYHQDVILFAGAQEFTYQLMLGRVEPGEHSLRIEFNRKESAAKATSVKIGDAKIATIDRKHPEFQAIARAPILYARPDTIGKFSDAPLLEYYESERADAHDRLTYTVIFSNEDGGTQTTALMARWGRTTDIEWACETRIGAEREAKTIFQAANHKDTQFAGKLEADHPLMFVATVNNNFSDQGQSEMRFAPRPLPFDARTASREEMMDRHPWTYRVMADEMIREEKITDERKPGKAINDLRNYVYFDISSNQTGAALSVAVKLKGDSVWRASDWGIANYRIDRSGNFRTTALLPRRARLEEIERIVARCDVKGDPRTQSELSQVPSASCDLRSVNKIFVLGDDYQPGASLKLSFQPVKIASGEMAEIYDSAAKR